LFPPNGMSCLLHSSLSCLADIPVHLVTGSPLPPSSTSPFLNTHSLSKSCGFVSPTFKLCLLSLYYYLRSSHSCIAALVPLWSNYPWHKRKDWHCHWTQDKTEAVKS
jgi:hypothetical protein